MKKKNIELTTQTKLAASASKVRYLLCDFNGIPNCHPK
jgi:hypothetical protein